MGGQKGGLHWMGSGVAPTGASMIPRSKLGRMRMGSGVAPTGASIGMAIASWGSRPGAARSSRPCIIPSSGRFRGVHGTSWHVRTRVCPGLRIMLRRHDVVRGCQGPPATIDPSISRGDAHFDSGSCTSGRARPRPRRTRAHAHSQAAPAPIAAPTHVPAPARCSSHGRPVHHPELWTGRWPPARCLSRLLLIRPGTEEVPPLPMRLPVSLEPVVAPPAGLGPPMTRP
jgi:hypothetical protein